MRVRNTIIIYLLLIFSAGLIISCGKNTGKLIKIDPDKSHINFSNNIIESDSVNIFDFANVYNGGGVGIGDFNGDGLMDIYFTGNMVANKLYLNKGNMEFQDITAEAGVGGTGNWYRGVSVIDINNDGKMDIYVCATAKKNPLERKNILYINQGPDKNGIPVFKDMAESYGIADTSQSTMAYFFDYDNDGDLDLFIGVNHIISGENANFFKKRNLNGEHPSTCKLFRNDWNDSLKHPVFTDVSRQAGILIEGYTHAVDILDINKDGWMDMLVTNDYLSNNVLYINNHDGTFTDQVMDYFKHTAANSMGSDAADLNNDGLEDIIEVDMDPQDNLRKKNMQGPNNYSIYQNSEIFGFQYQYPRNMLQANQGPTVGSMDTIKHPVFSDLGFYAGVAETDWSWTPLVADLDNDGLKDIIYTNGFPKDITDHDFIAFRQQAISLTSKKELLAAIPVIKIHNYAFKNEGSFKFTDMTKQWGLEEPTFSNGAVYVDLDNDGDLDVVINDIDEPALLYENRINDDKKNAYLDIRFQGSSKNIGGIGTRVVLHQKNNIQNFVNNPYRGYLSSVSPVMHFGLGSNSVIDSLEIFWPGNFKQTIKNPNPNRVISVHIQDAVPYDPPKKPVLAENDMFTNITARAGIHYVHERPDLIDFNIQKSLTHKFSEYNPALAVGDIDKNGLDDIAIGATIHHSPQFLLQQSNGSFIQKSLIPDSSLPGKQSVDEGILLFDADNDGDLDLYVAAGGFGYNHDAPQYRDRLYVNDGRGNFTEDSMALPLNFESKLCVRAVDYDKDGDLDLFISGRVDPWNYPKPVSSMILRNDTKDGKIKFTDVTSTVAKDLLNIGLTCDALFTDFDNDGWPDLVLVGEWMPVTFLKNDHGIFKNITKNTGISDQVGWWNSITAGDFDNDGDIDYIVGNLGENSFYRASDKYPVSVYASDFDKNGSYDPIPALFLPGSLDDPTMREYPGQVRDDVLKQVRPLQIKFPTHHSFAVATIDKLFTKEQLDSALILRANNLKSVFIRNDGNGKFTMTALPMQAQISILNGMVTDDFDGDGNLDIMINGNDYSTEPSVGRYDAMNGLVMMGDGTGKFTAKSILESGICIPGNGKALVKLKANDGRYLIAASQNLGPLELFALKRKFENIPIMPDETSAILKYKNGKIQKQEFYCGSSFLSQSGRLLIVGKDLASITFFNDKGRQRNLNF